MIEVDVSVLWKYKYSYTQHDLMVMEFPTVPWLEAPYMLMMEINDEKTREMEEAQSPIKSVSCHAL